MDTPDVDPVQASQAAVELYDANSDGKLDQEELKQCPAILHRIGKYDTDSDGQVSAEEIAARMEDWYETRVGMMTLNCRVTLDGAPLIGAEVRLTPEPFLAPVIKPASGVTEAGGLAFLSIAPEDRPADLQMLEGVHIGLYKAQITHPSKNLPAKYNTASTLGHEIAYKDQVGGIGFELRSR